MFLTHSGFSFYIYGMACEYTNLGTYDYCDGVDLSATITGEVSLLFIQTSRECTYADGNFGTIERGEYVFSFDSTNYYFKVI